jgi:hypothetical protein
MNTAIIILLTVIIVILLCDSKVSMQFGSISFGGTEEEEQENFGSLPNPTQEVPNINHMAQQLSTNEAENIIKNEKNIGEIQNPNLNTANNIPYLVTDKGDGYYQKRIKLETNPNSQLLMLVQKNKETLIDNISKCKRKRLNFSNMDNVKGYNNYYDLRQANPSPYDAIGRSLLTEYTDLPIAS